MFYIYADGKSIFQPMDDTLSLVSPKLTLEMGKAGSLQFQIPPTNKYYNAMEQLSTIVTVEMDDVEIFRGRVLTNNRNFYNMRTIYCEGDLAYLVDSVQKAEKFNGKAHELFHKIINAHNARMEASKRFIVGDITVEDVDVLLAGKSDNIQDAETGKFDYKQIAINSIADEWQNTFDFIETCLIDYTGGYLRTRHSGDITYIDLLSDYGSTAVQEIEFGKNLLDLTEEVSAEDIFTVLIPLGDENLTIESVNGGSDELVNAEAVERYGRIVKTHVFDSVNNPYTLLENGLRFLSNNVNVPVTITAKAVDMHLIDSNTSPIYIGDKVRITSMPHDMFDTLVCTKIEYDIENPANNTYTFGIPKPSLTERYRKDKAKEGKSGSGGGSAGSASGSASGSAGDAASEETQEKLDEFFKAWINVSSETAHIDLGTLYQKYTNDIKILESSCGISLDAPSGNVNIKSLREDLNEAGETIRTQSAMIDMLNNDLNSRIELVTARHNELDDREQDHYSELNISSSEQESKISATTEAIKTIKGRVDASEVEITELSNYTKAQLQLRTEHSTQLEGKIEKNETLLSTLSNTLYAQIELEAKHHGTVSDTIASIQMKANKNESSIKLKADKTYVDSEVLEVTGKIQAAEAKILSLSAIDAEIERIVSDRITAITGDVKWLTGKQLTLDVSLYSPIVRAGSIMTLGGKPVATQEWTKTTLKDYATQEWITKQGYLTGIPDYCIANNSFVAPIIRAIKTMTLENKPVATQEWVKQQLINYAKVDHTHSGYAVSNHSHTWSTILNKPTSFPASPHKHSFSGHTTLSIGHTHRVVVNGTTYTSQGMSANYSKTVNISGNTGNN